MQSYKLDFTRTYFGGCNVASRNSSIFGTSVRTSPSNKINGGFVPGAMSASSFGLLTKEYLNKLK